MYTEIFREGYGVVHLLRNAFSGEGGLRFCDSSNKELNGRENLRGVLGGALGFETPILLGTFFKFARVF